MKDLVYIRDGLGRPIQISQGEAIVKPQYDVLGRLVSETDDTLLSSKWIFDDFLGITDLTYPNGRIDRYHFDPLNRVSRITLHRLADSAHIPLTGSNLQAGDELASYMYVGPQRLYKRLLGNGCVTDYGYDQGRFVLPILNIVITMATFWFLCNIFMMLLEGVV